MQNPPIRCGARLWRRIFFVNKTHKDETIWISGHERLEPQLFRLFVFPDFKIRKSGYFAPFHYDRRGSNSPISEKTRRLSKSALFQGHRHTVFDSSILYEVSAPNLLTMPVSRFGAFLFQKGRSEHFGERTAQN